MTSNPISIAASAFCAYERKQSIKFNQLINHLGSPLGWSFAAEIISPSLKEKKGYLLPGKVMHMKYEQCGEVHMAGLSVIMP